MNATGRILPRKITGSCAKHQRKINRVIKTGIHMGLMSYKTGFSVHNPFPVEEEELQLTFDEDPDETQIAKPYMPEYTEPIPPFKSYSHYLNETGHPMVNI